MVVTLHGTNGVEMEFHSGVDPVDICTTTTTTTTNKHSHLYHYVTNGFKRVTLRLRCESDPVVTSPWEK